MKQGYKKPSRTVAVFKELHNRNENDDDYTEDEAERDTDLEDEEENNDYSKNVINEVIDGGDNDQAKLEEIDIKLNQPIVGGPQPKYISMIGKKKAGDISSRVSKIRLNKPIVGKKFGSQPKYISMVGKKTEGDLLKKDISPRVSKIVTERLAEMYNNVANNGNLAAGELFASKLEQELSNKFRSKPIDYFTTVTKILMFLDNTNAVGQFANLFRNKTLQNIYTPARLVVLDVTDMLPEVFLNPKSTPADKLQIYQQINALINSDKDTLINGIEMIMNPSAARRPQTKLPVSDPSVIIRNNKIPVKDLCENPYWKMKEVNIIICRENGKFYCLDIVELITEIAKTGVAKNYYTGNQLDDSINENLRNRFAKEIKELSSGLQVDLGHRTKGELTDLAKTRADLIRFKEVLNMPEMIVQVQMFGIDAIDDPMITKAAGRRFEDNNGFNSIPQLTRDKFDEYLDEDPDTAIEKINIWLDENILYINQVLGQSGRVVETVTVSNQPQAVVGLGVGSVDEAYNNLVNLIEEIIKKCDPILLKQEKCDMKFIYELITRRDQLIAAGIDRMSAQDQQTLLAKLDALYKDVQQRYGMRSIRLTFIDHLKDGLGELVDVEEPTIAGGGEGVNKKYEEKLIHDEILKEGTVSMYVFNKYLQRLESMQKAILDNLKKTVNMQARNELNNNLLEVNKELQNVRRSGKSIKGIISLLESTLTTNTNKLAELSDAMGMQYIYPKQLEAAHSEIAQLKDHINKIQQEIAYLEEQWNKLR